MNTTKRFELLREKHLPQIMALIDEVVSRTTPVGSSLVDMCHYHFETGGKRLRALLPLLVAESIDSDPASLVPFGAACEMLHNATLVHDDIQDGDLIRRGRETVWKRFGEAQAINLGDAMFYFSVLLCQRLEVPAPRREAAVRRVLLETLRVIDGQEREFALRHAERPTLSDYFVMVEGKTSGLFALPTAGAAALCDASREVVDGLEEAARHMGVLFQLQDDTLDLYGDKGRDVRGSDIGEGKRSVLVVHALEAASADDSTWLRGVLDKPRDETTQTDVDQVLALFERTGSLRFALREMRERRDRAVGLDALAPYPRLRSMVGGMCDRFLDPIKPLLNVSGAQDEQASHLGR